MNKDKINKLEEQFGQINIFYLGDWDIFDIEDVILQYLNTKQEEYQEIHKDINYFTRYYKNITGLLEAHYKSTLNLDDIEYIIKYVDFLYCENLAGKIHRITTLEFMCELINILINSNKTLFATAYNPIVFDTLNLNDDRLRLFSVYYNKNNDLELYRITIKDKPKSSVRDRLSRLLNDNKTYSKSEILELFDNSLEPLKFSDAYLRGYI